MGENPFHHGGDIQIRFFKILGNQLIGVDQGRFDHIPQPKLVVVFLEFIVKEHLPGQGITGIRRHGNALGRFVRHHRIRVRQVDRNRYEFRF